MWQGVYISKHLMLLFNEEKQKYFSEIAKLFQNISCYCLTPDQMLSVAHLLPFQNISCYCLTAHITHKGECIMRFQNISCYCLTRGELEEVGLTNHFKTSHVIV